MWIVMLNSGLGNQMFQYIFALYLSQNGAHVMIDDSAFFGTHVEHNGLEVPRFFPKGMLLRLSEHFTPDVWTAMLDRKENGMSIPDQLLAGGIDLHYVRQDAGACPAFGGKINEISAADRDAVLSIPRDRMTYFAGYWMDFGYFLDIQSYFWKYFRFPSYPTTAQAETAQKIMGVQNAAAIHVRRGDMAQLGLSNPPVYFKRAIAELEKLVSIDHFFLFSDDLGYCMEHAEELGIVEIRSRMTAVDGNRGLQSYVDMQLMSLCRYRIADRSSFSQLAGVLCRLPGNATTVWENGAITAFGVPACACGHTACA